MRYDRFWDIHVTGSNGWYDFAGAIPDMADYTVNRMGGYLNAPGSVRLIANPLPNVRGVLAAAPLAGPLPDQGYVASMVSITDIQNQAVAPTVQAILNWVGNAYHSGKIRINCHGDTDGGLLFMHTDAARSNPDVCFFGSIADWLAANGLPKVAFRSMWRKLGKNFGLATISLAVCHSSKARGSQVGLYPDIMSGVDQVVARLQEHGYSSISVSGHDEPFSAGLGAAAQGLMAAELAEAHVDGLAWWDPAVTLLATAKVSSLQQLGTLANIPQPLMQQLTADINNALLHNGVRNALIQGFTEQYRALTAARMANAQPGQVLIKDATSGQYVRFAHHAGKKTSMA